MIRRLGTLLAAVAIGLAAVAAAVARPAAAQDAASDPSAALGKVGFDFPTVSRGGTARLVIEIVSAPGSHISAQDGLSPPTFAWTLPAGWTAGRIEDLSASHEIPDFGKVIAGTAKIAQSFSVGQGAALGRVEIKGTADWQVCNDSLCLQTTGVALAASVDVGPAETTPPAGAGQAPAAAPSDRGGAAFGGASEEPGKSWASILGQALFWGFITVLTPCVFPLLPVTVSFFSKQEGPALPRATVYGLGIVFTIVVIGLIFKSSLDVMARGWVFNLAVGILFLALSLSLFGLFELRLPGFLTNFAAARSQKGGLIGPFFMAVTLALTSFSCSMPFLAAMFTQFDEGNTVQAVVGLTVYGATMAFPFFLCSLFPAALRTMPRAGGWMQAIKVTMGFVEFALAFKFLRTVTLSFGVDWLPRSLVLAVWAACALAAALYLFGHLVLLDDTKPESIGVFRMIAGVVFLAGALYMVPGISGRPLADWLEAFIQTQEKDLAAAGDGGVREADHLVWPRDDWDGALVKAKLLQKPVLFDFTGVG